MFNCFIIARSFISDSDETLEFFDGCIERLEENSRLLHETDSNKGITVVVQTETMAKGMGDGDKCFIVCSFYTIHSSKPKLSIDYIY